MQSTSAFPKDSHIFFVYSRRSRFLPVRTRVRAFLENWIASSLPRPLLAPVMRTTG